MTGWSDDQIAQMASRLRALHANDGQNYPPARMDKIVRRWLEYLVDVIHDDVKWWAGWGTSDSTNPVARAYSRAIEMETTSCSTCGENEASCRCQEVQE